ncbi:MAG: hypothetical protein RLY78_3044, partial [Pseudomonadota bacterium]
GNYTVTEVNPAGVLDVADKDGGDLNNIAVTVVAGQASTGNVFVDEKAAKLGDKVWLDADADGQQDAGEAGVANVTVQLLNAAGTVLATTTTDAAGNYLFDNLAPGAYTVKFVTPTGYTLTTANVGADATDSDANATTGLTGTYTLNAGDANLTADAGLVALPTSGAVTGKVLLDSNNDNVGDTPPAGVTVQLRNAAGTVVATTTTGADGSYAFTGVAPGSYTVTEVNPAGVLDVADKDGGNLNSIAVTVVAGQTNTGNDFVDEKVAKIGDKVWVDANGNGVQDTGEVGLAGATVTLRDSAGNAVATTTTDASGVYGFDVAPGSYSVQVTAPTGYVFTGKDSGSNDAVDSDVDATTGRSATVSVNAGDVVSSLDAGLYKKASLGDKVWFDTDGDGQQDAGEAGAAGVTVQLLNAAGTVVATQLTNASGNYLFSDLAPGSYSVKFVAPSGYKFTTANSGADATDSDVDGTTGTTGSYTLASGDARTDVDAGLKVCLVKIGDKVWLDADKDGVQDAGEAGVAGVTVKLVGAGTDGVLGTSDDTVRTTTTDASGNYSFADVAHGSYRVQLVVPSSYALTTANVGTNDAVDSDFVKSTVLGTTNLIVNGSFEATQTAGYYSSFSGWCAVNDKIELNKATAYGVNGASGNMVVELDANACVTGGLYQEVKTTAGQTYELSVDLAQRAGYSASTNTVEIYWAGTKIATIDPSSTTLTTYTFSVTGTGGNDRLTFKETSNDDDSIGGIIDNVKLVTKDTVVQTDVTVNTCADNLTVDAGLTTTRDIGVDIEKYVSTVRTSTSTTGGTEGATCSYWKSATTFNWYSWSYEFTGTGCKTGTSFNSLFGTSDSSYGNCTLAQVLAFTETSGKKALMREAVAAYLNACHSSVDYEYSKDQVCQQVKYCFTSGSYDSSFASFKYENEQGCNWSTSKTTSTSVVDTQLYDADAPPGLDVTTGSTVVFTYKVTNTGDAALKNVTVTDDRIQSISYVSGDINCNGLLDVGETWTYTARETASSGTIKNVGTVTATDTVDGATKVTDSDAAYYTGAASTAKGAIGDRVWADTDCDGVQDSTEKGVAGVTVKLKGAGTDGVFGTTDDIAASTVTDANGRYQFSGLAAGKYQVEFTAANATFTGQNKGTNDACDSDADASGTTGVITLAAGEQNLTVDAGLVTTGKASVGNMVWQDSNHNNVYDAGECGIEGVTVRLYSASTGAVVATCKTDDDGKYLFSGLAAGSYFLEFDKTNVIYDGINLNAWKYAVKDSGSNDLIDSDVAGDAAATTNVSRTSTFTLTAGQNDVSKDAGITPLVIDLDGDGIQTLSRENSAGTFDLLGTGHGIDSGWISSGDGFLAVDKDGNGTIDGIDELFGGVNQGDGYADLAAYDSNGDGFVNASDAAFAELKIWQDIDGDHVTDAGELYSLADAGIVSLQVAHTSDFAVDAQGNVHGESSAVTLADGRSVTMTDIYFNVSSEDAAAAGITAPTIGELLGDDVSLDTVLGQSAVAATTVATASCDSACTAAADTSELLRKLTTLQTADTLAHA